MIPWQDFLVRLSPDGKASLREGTKSKPLPAGYYVSHGYPQAPGQSGLPQLAWPAHWLGSQLRWHPDHLEILTDHSGCYPIYEARAADGSIYLSTEAWTAARAAGLNRISTEAAFELIAFEYVLGTHTLVEGLTELRQGTRFLYRHESSGWTRIDQTVWEYDHTGDSPLSGDALRRAAADNLLEQAHACQQILTFSQDSRLALNLSGGWDSRALLGAMHSIDSPPAFTCTYGNPNFSGVQRARVLSGSLHIENRLAEMTDGDFLRQLHPTLCRELPPVVRYNLGDGGHLVASQFYGDATAAMAGHSGDFFTGLPPHSSNITSHGDLTRWIHRTVWGTLPRNELENLLLPHHRRLATLPGERLAASAKSHSPDLAGAMWWKLHHRIRRITATELRVLQRYAPLVLTPMFHREWCNFWRRVPASDLHDQRLYREALARHIFTGPRTLLRTLPREAGGRLLPTPMSNATRFVRQNTYRVLRRVAPGLASRATVADPTAAWWATDPTLRQWAWSQLEQSPFIQTYFNPDALRAAVLVPNPPQRSLPRTGIWNLLTITGTEQILTTGPAQPAPPE